MRLCLILIAVLFPLAAEAGKSGAARIFEAARADCESLGGLFSPGEGSLSEVDLARDEAVVTLVDGSKFSCSAAASLYCGSGGCSLYAVVGDETYEWQATGHRILDWGQDRILLIARDGGWCGGAGAERCYEALVWSNGRFLTVMPPYEPSAD